MENNIQNSQNDPNEAKWKDNFSKLNDWESMPPLDGWDKISEQLDKPSKLRVIYWMLPLALLLIFAIGFYLISSKNQNTTDIALQEKNQVQKQQNKQIELSSKKKNNRISEQENSVNAEEKNQNVKDKAWKSQITNTETINSNAKRNQTSIASKNIRDTSTDSISSQKIKNSNSSSNTDSGNSQNNDTAFDENLNVDDSNSTAISYQMNLDKKEKGKKIVSALVSMPIREIKLDFEPSAEVQIEPIKLFSKNDTTDSLNKTNPITKQRRGNHSPWKIISYTGLGLTYQHLTANSNDNHYVRMINEGQTFNERQSLTFGFSVEKILSKKWNLHTGIGILKWKNTVEYEFIQDFYLPPTDYNITKIATNHIAIQPIFDNRGISQTEKINYATTYFKADIGISYSLFQSQRWKHQTGIRTGIFFLTNSVLNINNSNSVNFPKAKPLVPFVGGFYQTNYQFSKRWGVFGESSLKYLPNTIGDSSTIWQICFSQINLHLGISYKF